MNNARHREEGARPDEAISIHVVGDCFGAITPRNDETHTL